MKCCWRTILLLLAVIISTSIPPVVTQSASTVTSEDSTENSTPETTFTEVTSPPPADKASGPTSPPNTETTKENITPSETTKGSTKETSTAPAARSSLSTTPSGTSESTSPISISESTPTSTSESTSPTGTSESTSPTDTSESAPPTSTSESTSQTGTSESTSQTSTSPSTSPTGASPSTPPSITSESTLPTGASESTATSSSSVATTPAAPSLGILISETNLLLANNSSRHFVEIQVTKKLVIDSAWLVIQNASVDTTEGLLLKQQINISSCVNGLCLYENDTELSSILKSVDSVLIALYDNEGNAGQLTANGLHDILLYSSSGNINPDLKKRFAINQNLIIDYEKLSISVAVSLSRCSENETANSDAALTNESPGKPNDCSFTFTKPLQMKLTRKNLPCSFVPSNDFQSALKDCVISNVNENQQCGLAAYMMTGMTITPACISDGKELDVRFTVNSAFPNQVNLIKEGYITFVNQTTWLTIKEEKYDLFHCYEDCFDQPAPPASNKDDRIRVTVAVVVSCICVFLVVLLFVVLYLRRKRRGVLQFHMTRLDEDDDLAGDMDDFVGNQGPTFRSYR